MDAKKRLHDTEEQVSKLTKSNKLIDIKITELQRTKLDEKAKTFSLSYSHSNLQKKIADLKSKESELLDRKLSLTTMISQLETLIRNVKIESAINESRMFTKEGLHRVLQERLESVDFNIEEIQCEPESVCDDSLLL